MWSLQKLVEFMTTMYSLHNPGGLGAGDVTPSGQRQVQLAPAIPLPPELKLALSPCNPSTPPKPKPPPSQCKWLPLISVG
jgi:hypothetical protein